MTLVTLDGVDLDVPEDQYAAYLKLLQMGHDIEERFKTSFAVVVSDPTEDALRAAGLTDAQIAVVKMLQSDSTDSTDSTAPTLVDPADVVAEVVIPTGELRTCTKHRGGYHVPSRYGLLADTPTTKRVMGFCSCGYQFQKLVKCPHQQQSLPGGRTGPVVCNWCASIVYGGTGATGLDEALAKQQTSLPDVNPDSFMGNL